MTKQEFKELTTGRVLILDGATGSNLLKRGMPQGVCTELWVEEHPQVLRDLQREYVERGSNIVYAPTFSGNRIKLAEYGAEDRLKDLNKILVGISREAVAGKAYVAGDLTMTGAQLEPMGDLTFQELVNIYREQAEALVEAGVDLMVVETMMSLQETRAAVLAVRAVCELPVMATLSFQENGNTLYGVSAEAAVVTLQNLGVDAVGLNCSSGPDHVYPVVERMMKVAKIPVIVKPNAGLPKLEADGTTGYDMGPKEFCAHMKKLLEAGVGLVGGCCGTAPEFISGLAELRDSVENVPMQNSEEDQQVYLASQRQVYAFELGQEVTLGVLDYAEDQELVKDFQEEAYDTALDLAMDLSEDYDLILLRASVPEVDEKEALLGVAQEISGMVGMPCVIDTEDPEVLEYVVQNFPGIIAIQARYNLEEWKAEFISIAKAYHLPVVTIDNKIIYC